jgi:hypothetical protein
MPSPFPGMDPYLEGSEWTSVHAELGSEIARQLSPKLRPKYIVRISRRLVSEVSEDVGIVTSDLYPDVSVMDADQYGGVAESAVVVAQPPLQMATVIPARVPLISVEIRDVANRDLVTAIEVLSPTNKRGEGYQEYLDRRLRILRSTAHLMEIDLLRIGRRVPMQKPLPPAPYFVFLSRTEKRPIVEIWPIQLSMRLPVVPVPLLPGDPDVALDLQLALNTVYDALNYDLSVDYTRPPEVPLDEKNAAWADECVREAGIQK